MKISIIVEDYAAEPGLQAQAAGHIHADEFPAPEVLEAAILAEVRRLRHAVEMQLAAGQPRAP